MRDSFRFGAKTFVYFDGAAKHAADRAWFDAHLALYADGVEVPFSHLVSELRDALSPSLPDIGFSLRKITKPLLRKPKDAEGPLLRENATAYFAETATSMFETNPGVYLSFGTKSEDNVIGCGIYMPSARQMRQLRMHFSSQAGVLRSILEEKTLHERWGGLSGERYTRYPKGFDESAPGGEYRWHKQFFLGKQLSRKEICGSRFIADTVGSMVAALPFLRWTRNAVGVYRKPPAAREE